MKTFRRSSGITLIALVVTIVVLLILAGITIMLIFNENGIIAKAREASESSERMVEEDEAALDSMDKQIGNALGEDTTGKSEVEDAVGKDEGFAETTIIKDDLENEIVIPGGFKIPDDSGTLVEDGIVIEEITTGNQYVWIPVGSYKTTSGAKTNELTRRTFSGASATPIEKGEVIEGTGENAYKFYGEENEASCLNQYNILNEDDENYKYSLNYFESQAIKNGGFYIGRFEVGKDGSNLVIQQNKLTYYNVTRDKALEDAKTFSAGNSNTVTSLISSYAWDTALNFICQNSEAGYELAITDSQEYGNIDTGNTTASRLYTGTYKYNSEVSDKYSNIYDMLGNLYEWTTEYCQNGAPCTYRGAGFNGGGTGTAERFEDFTYKSYPTLGFRVQLTVE